MPGRRVVGWLVAPSKDFSESSSFAIHWDGCCCYCVMLYCFNDGDGTRFQCRTRNGVGFISFHEYVSVVGSTTEQNPTRFSIDYYVMAEEEVGG